MENKSFYDINSSSLLIQIFNCDELIIKTGAFEYMQVGTRRLFIMINMIHILSVNDRAKCS